MRAVAVNNSLVKGLIVVAVGHSLLEAREPEQSLAEENPGVAHKISRAVATSKVLDAVQLKNLNFDGESMEEAIQIVANGLDAFCEKKGIARVTIQPATSKREMSFGSTCMTARMCLNMIASEVRGDFHIDEEARSVSFSGPEVDKPRKPGDPPPFDLGKARGKVHRASGAMAELHALAPYMDPRVAAQSREAMEEASRLIEELSSGMGNSLAAMRKSFRDRFQSLEEVVNPAIRIAARSKAFIDAPPKEISIGTVGKGIRVSKSVGSTAHHACLAYPLRDGPCLIVKFRLTKRGDGGTPVPYFGVRDASGGEDVLCNFATSQKPEVVHEIHLLRRGHDFALLYNDQVITKRRRSSQGDLFPFFHLNAESEVVIESVRIPAP